MCFAWPDEVVRAAWVPRTSSELFCSAWLDAVVRVAAAVAAGTARRQVRVGTAWVPAALPVPVQALGLIANALGPSY